MHKCNVIAHVFGFHLTFFAEYSLEINRLHSKLRHTITTFRINDYSAEKK